MDLRGVWTGPLILALAGCLGTGDASIEQEVDVASQALLSTGSYHFPYQLLDQNSLALETNWDGDGPTVAPQSNSGLFGRSFSFVRVSGPDPERITSGDTVRVVDNWGRAVRHATSYASMGAQDSQSTWRVVSTSGAGTIHPGEVFRLEATDNSYRLKSQWSGVRVRWGTGSSSNWRIGCNFIPGAYADDWTTRPTFSAVTNPLGQLVLSWATSWLQAHTASVTLPSGSGTLIAWDDPSVDPDDPDTIEYFDPNDPGYVAYLMDDNLWALHALEPFDPDLSDAIKDSILRTGWYGGRLFDALFHHVGTTIAVGAGQMNDPDQGIPLGSCGTDDGRAVQVRAFDYTIDAAAVSLGIQNYTDIAIYEALNQFWSSSSAPIRFAARAKVKALVDDTRASAPDLMFWDTEKAALVDSSTRADFDNGGTYTIAPYKLGLVLYAIRLMGVTGIPESTIDRMKERLGEAQWWPFFGELSGGVSHLVQYDENGQFVLASGPTGEATSIAIMAHTVDPAP